MELCPIQSTAVKFKSFKFKTTFPKITIISIGLINNQKKIQLCPSSDNVQVPIIEKKNAQVLSVHSDSATVMDNDSFETFDIKITEEFKPQVKEGSVVNYWVIMDEKVIMQVK